MKIARCLHTALLVSDLERAERFYGKILGLPEVERPMKFPGTWYQVGEFQIHLIVATNYCASIQNQEKWGRNPHIAFAVEDLEAIKERLDCYDIPMQPSASGRTALFARDPDGNIVELSQI